MIVTHPANVQSTCISHFASITCEKNRLSDYTDLWKLSTKYYMVHTSHSVRSVKIFIKING